MNELQPLQCLTDAIQQQMDIANTFQLHSRGFYNRYFAADARAVVAILAYMTRNNEE